MKLIDAMSDGAQPHQGGPAPSDGIPPQPDGVSTPEDDSQPTPEEQQQYERIVLAGVKVVTEGKDQILQILRSGKENPPQALADTLWVVMSALIDRSKGDIAIEVLVPAGAEILENIGEMAQASGVFQVDETTINKAWMLTLQRVEQEMGVDWGQEMGEDVQGLDPQTSQEIQARFGDGVPPS